MLLAADFKAIFEWPRPYAVRKSAGNSCFTAISSPLGSPPRRGGSLLRGLETGWKQLGNSQYLIYTSHDMPEYGLEMLLKQVLFDHGIPEIGFQDPYRLTPHVMLVSID